MFYVRVTVVVLPRQNVLQKPVDEGIVNSISVITIGV